MTGDEIEDIVRRAIGNEWSRTNLHRVDLRACLLTPRKIRTIDVCGEREKDVWLVLHEVPGSGDGFGVAFDESSDGFGLVEFRQGYQPCFHGVAGDFFAALDAM